MLQEGINSETKRIIAETLSGLMIFAEQRVAHGAEDAEINLIRKTAEEMSAYWCIDILKDWQQEFDRRMRQIRQGDKPLDIPMADKIAALYGLAGYSEEMMYTHGGEEEERQKEIQQVMKKIEQIWDI